MAGKAHGRQYHILLVEDDLADALLVEEALLEGAEGRYLVRMPDGVAALDYLRDSSKPRPDLIVLDLNMPRMNGAEMLKILKEDEELKTIPVVILTTSHASADFARAHDTHASAYVVKPLNLDEFTSAVQDIDTFYRELTEPLPEIR